MKANDGEKFVYHISGLDDFCKVKSIAPSNVKTTITQTYRFLLSDYSQRNELVSLITLVMRGISDPKLPPAVLKQYTTFTLPDGRWWRMFNKEFNKLYDFLIEHIQITSEDAAMLIDLRIAKVEFTNAYMKVTTKLNTEVIENGFD